MLECCLGCLSDQSCVTGGEAEAQAAYDEAYNAVFHLQLECHRHAQPHASKKNGKTKWTMIEMWPMVVSSAAQFSTEIAPVVMRIHSNHPMYMAHLLTPSF